MKNYTTKEVNELLDKYNKVLSEERGLCLDVINMNKDSFKRYHGLIEEALEVGWYATTEEFNEDWLCYFNGKKFIYGFDANNEWTTMSCQADGTERKATHKEIKDALIKHWEKDNKGLKDYTFNSNNGRLIGWIGSEPIETLFKGGTWFPIAKKTTRQPLENEVLTETDKVEIMWNDRGKK